MTSLVQALAQSRPTRSGRDTEARRLNAAARILMGATCTPGPHRLNEPGFRILRNSEGSPQSASLQGWATSISETAASIRP